MAVKQELVLGLGGWFLGALIVMTTLPGVPLDDELKRPGFEAPWVS